MQKRHGHPNEIARQISTYSMHVVRSFAAGVQSGFPQSGADMDAVELPVKLLTDTPEKGLERFKMSRTSFNMTRLERFQMSRIDTNYNATC